MSDPKPYPDFECSEAPLRKGEAPQPDCECKVCRWLRDNAKREAAKRG